jgi:NAD-dependent dihydropyrimidine dehydrogenase PreA subunit
MTFGFPFYVDAGQGRNISQEEALSLIDQAEKEGLVLQPSNTRDLFCICLCCGDCCEVLTGAKTFDRPADYLISNFYVVHNPELCQDCGVCMERCQMEAIRKADGVYQIDLGRCIGCGLCVSTCPGNANKLVQKKELRVPPKGITDMYLTMLERKAGRRAKMLFMLKTLAGQ